MIPVSMLKMLGRETLILCKDEEQAIEPATLSFPIPTYVHSELCSAPFSYLHFLEHVFEAQNLLLLFLLLLFYFLFCLFLFETVCLCNPGIMELTM